jgi:uncharacterized damage-inducible protein DinB
MTRGQRAAQSIERSLSGPMWHGPALMDLLGDVSAEQAAGRPVPGVHTIWELVLHITAWTDIVRERMSTAEPIEASGEQDWPRVGDMSAESWRNAVERLKEAKRMLAEEVRELPDARFEERVPGRDYGLGVMLRGVVEHDTYHGGQIALLKKALTRGKA